MLRKWLLTAAVSAAISSLLLVVADPTYAQSSRHGGASVRSGGPNGTGGYCPVGTCGKNGGPTATNIKNCSAANCRRK
jgi:hypothetical protein